MTSTTLLSDQRGAVAFEMLIVWSFLMMFLLLPLADVAVAGFQYISAWQALRAFGQSIQYYPPPDVTDRSGWKSANYPLRRCLQVIPSPYVNLCGDSHLSASGQHAAQVLFIHDDRHLVADGR